MADVIPPVRCAKLDNVIHNVSDSCCLFLLYEVEQSKNVVFCRHVKLDKYGLTGNKTIN